MWRKGGGGPLPFCSCVAEVSRGGDGGAAGADDEDTLAVIGKKREELLVEEGLTVGATVGDENIAWQESGVVGGVSSSDLSITPLLQIQEHRLPDGHCQS